MTRRFNVFRCNNAQAMVEFLLVFPVFMILFFGILEFSLLSLAHQNVNFASFKSARAKIVGRKPGVSAWMSLYMLSPHWIDELSPLDAFKVQYPDFSTRFNLPDSLDLNLKFKIFEFMFDSPCLLEIFGIGDSPKYSFVADFSTSIGLPLNNIEDFINFLLQKIIGAASGLMNDAVDEFNNGIEEAGYDLPPFIRKALYAYALTEVETIETDDPEIPSVEVRVTYYYPLNFPVVQSLISFIYEMRPGGDDDMFAETYESGWASKWEKAKEFTDKSGRIFVPIIHSCKMGNELKLVP